MRKISSSGLPQLARRYALPKFNQVMLLVELISTLREAGNPVPIMKAEWNGEIKRWFEGDSKLTADLTDYFSDEVEPLVL